MSKSNNKHIQSVSKLELMNISQILFDADKNDFLSRVTINYQGFLNSSNVTEDCAPDSLLTVDPAIYHYDTIKKMRILYDNFEANSSIDENVTQEEDEEENDFIAALLETSVMKHAMDFLEQKGSVAADRRAHFELIKRLWFAFYPRNKNTTKTSSGFEHVFLSEIKKGKIIGLHNWIYFAEAEQKGELNYKGWLNEIDFGEKAKLLKVKLSINNLNKSVTSFFVGTSPELELALYTICFQLRPNKGCSMAFNGTSFSILTHSLDHENKRFIGSAYVLA